jgi:hypothetical protein
LIEKIKKEFTDMYELEMKKIEIKQKIIQNYETIKYNYNSIKNVQNIINQNNNIKNGNNSGFIKDDNSPNPIVETIYVNEKLKQKNEEPLNQNIENINIIPGQYYMKNSHDMAPPVNQTSNKDD